MFELKIFESEQFGLIRTMVDDKTQEVVFNGNDVAKALGYVDVKQALRDHTKGGVVLTTPSPGGPQKMKYIPEPDLYRLIMASKLPDAVKFQDWVCEVILPQIRKTGGFIPVTAQDDEKTILAKALLILQRTLNQKDALIAANQPKVNFADSLLSHNPSISMAQMAKLITQNGHRIGRTQLFQVLRELGYIFQRSTLPIQRFVNAGIFELHTSLITVHGRQKEVTTTKVTAKGQEYFLRYFKENYL